MAKMPKRNKSKDNPYTLGFDEEAKSYTIEFVDNKKVINKIFITKEIYEAFDKFELEDISQIHKYRSHIEHSEIYEETLNKRMIYKQISLEEKVERKEMSDELIYIIESLPLVQKRRIKKYYFLDMTLEQIAKEEGCTKRAVKFSIDIALQKISQKIKK